LGLCAGRGAQGVWVGYGPACGPGGRALGEGTGNRDHVDLSLGVSPTPGLRKTRAPVERPYLQSRDVLARPLGERHRRALETAWKRGRGAAGRASAPTRPLAAPVAAARLKRSPLLLPNREAGTGRSYSRAARLSLRVERARGGCPGLPGLARERGSGGGAASRLAELEVRCRSVAVARGSR
jgi:hypothetical protein